MSSDSFKRATSAIVASVGLAAYLGAFQMMFLIQRYSKDINEVNAAANEIVSLYVIGGLCFSVVIVRINTVRTFVVPALRFAAAVIMVVATIALPVLSLVMHL